MARAPCPWIPVGCAAPVGLPGKQPFPPARFAKVLEPVGVAFPVARPGTSSLTGDRSAGFYEDSSTVPALRQKSS